MKTVPADGLIVLAVLPDNKIRQIPLTIKQGARLRRFLTREHGGNLHISTKDLLLMSEKDALEVFGKLTGRIPIAQRIKNIFVKPPTPAQLPEA